MRGIGGAIYTYALYQEDACMYANHQRTIDRLHEHFRADPRFPAIILGGSVAKGWAAPNSDVDIILVATDEEFARRAASREYLYFTQEFSDYEGGYVDGKIVNAAFLEEVADHGSEVARAAFVSTQIIHSSLPGLDDLLARIPVYPEAERDQKLKSFYSQVIVGGWFFKEAEKRGDKYLMTHAASDLALFGCRLILAYNRILYPYHKWLLHVVAQAPEKPANFMALLQAVLDQPGPATADAFAEALTAFHDWGVSFGETFVNFTRDQEWNWRTGRAPIYDW